MSLRLITNGQTPLTVCCGEDVFLKQCQGPLRKDGDERQLTAMQDNDPVDTWETRHTDGRTKLRTMETRETRGGHRAFRGQQAARSWSSGQEPSLPKSGGVPDGTSRAGVSSGLKKHGQPAQLWTQVTLPETFLN